MKQKIQLIIASANLQIPQVQIFRRNGLCCSPSSASDPAYKRFLLIVVSFFSLWDGEMWGLEGMMKGKSSKELY